VAGADLRLGWDIEGFRPCVPLVSILGFTGGEDLVDVDGTAAVVGVALRFGSLRARGGAEAGNGSSAFKRAT
jgi:hypothetical protein